MFDLNYNSFLFIPYNKIKYFYNELANQADVIIVDFEGSVNYKTGDISIKEFKKALSHLNKKNLIARIGIGDYPDIVKSLGVDSFSGVMIPKFANTKEIIEVIQDLINNSKRVYLLIEDAKGLLDLQLVLSNYKIDGVFFGSEDYISNLNAMRTEINLQYARSTIINLSRAFKVSCYDTIYPFLNDEKGFKEEVQLAFEMGFNGKMAIHPLQLKEINKTFKVTPHKIAEYKTLIGKYTEYTHINNTRVMVVDGMLIEPPHIGRMKSIIKKFEGRNENE